MGLLDPLALTRRLPAETARIVLLAGRSWRVTYVDWARRQAFGEPVQGRGAAQWQGSARPSSFVVTRAAREVLLGADPPAVLSRRAVAALDEVRRAERPTVDAEALVVTRDRDTYWWTWAGAAANLTLAAALPAVVDPEQRTDDRRLRLLPSVTAGDLARAVAREVPGAALPAPAVDEAALAGLKFSDALPAGLAAQTLGARLGDPEGAREVLRSSRRWVLG